MLGVMAIIFFLSHTPGDDLPSTFSGFDKICHAVAYATLAASCLYAIHPMTRNRSLFWSGLGVILFCLLYGLTDEFHQSFIASRTPSFQDIVPDTGGATLLVLFWYRWRTGGRRSFKLVDSA